MRRFVVIVSRVLAGLGVLFVAFTILAVAYRLPLAEWALRDALQDAGVQPLAIKVAQLGLHQATIAPLEIGWNGQRLLAASITVSRPRFFSRSLGRIRMAGLALALDPAAAKKAVAAPEAAASETPAAMAPGLPFDGLSADGRIVVRGPAGIQTLEVVLFAQPDSSGHGLDADIRLTSAAGMVVAKGNYDFSRTEGTFALTEGQLDLAAGRRWVEQFVPLPFPAWEIAGRLTMTANGRIKNGAVSGQARLQLRDGMLCNAGSKISLDGIEGDWAVDQLQPLSTPPAQTLHVKSVRIGDVVLQNADIRFQLGSPQQMRIESADVAAFGGKIAVEPFSFNPTVVDYAVTLKCEGVKMESVLALFPAAKAKASGVADGKLPLHYGPQGIHFSQGWLALRAGQTGSLQIDQPGLLTGNLSPQSVAYPTLKAVESGLLNLRVDTLRAEVYPPGAPSGRSVQIRIAGEPMDPSVKAPVTFDININGPVEKLIQWGLDSRMKISTK